MGPAFDMVVKPTHFAIEISPLDFKQLGLFNNNIHADTKNVHMKGLNFHATTAWHYVCRNLNSNDSFGVIE